MSAALALAFVLAFAAPDSRAAEKRACVSAAPGRAFKLPKGRCAALGKLELRFLSVLEDSRCPADARCVWAGRARASFSIASKGAAPEAFELTAGDDQGSVRLGRRIRLAELTPAPVSGRETQRPEYEALVSVSTDVSKIPAK